MTIREIKVNGNKYQFCNEAWSNSNGWGHRTILLRNGYQLNENKVRYLNRTWERYEFQSCMQGCIYPLIEQRKAELKEQFKAYKNITRLSQKYAKEYEQFEKQDERLKEYTKLYKSL